ncbi:DUF1579 domain-containing protein [Rhizobium sp. SSA_523]|uniref:DUF1579 domain-containing protein n=1 Tax=Rhizobium sp. SSA_523 TaxID=2952477 RepID=UPI0020903006|nr:DUF1579 domain-containing protein [Rhizobium sp. SSA_523]MCO5731902.1 DUF1579 domain-containing protein [Rhizobium sp. SSA_523]WKC25711.1 DUF1579 domain-containing protein [Rhizobium sp. SSA_523]
MTMPKPRAEHAFLQRLVGRWQVSAADMTDGEDWIEEVRSLHDLWFVAEGRGKMPGGAAATTVLTLGYNSQTGRYIGSWIGTMMEHMWVYDGDVSEDGSTLSLYTTGPSFDDPSVTQAYREEIIFTGDDTRIFTSSAKQPDGGWHTFMRADYKRLA